MEDKGKAETLVQLKRELQLMHKRSRTEDGQLGIVWWNQEYWDTGMGLKRLKMVENEINIKKEEPLTPLLHIKVESPWDRATEGFRIYID